MPAPKKATKKITKTTKEAPELDTDVDISDTPEKTTESSADAKRKAILSNEINDLAERTRRGC